MCSIVAAPFRHDVDPMHGKRQTQHGPERAAATPRRGGRTASTAPTLAVIRLRSLLRADGTLLASLPIVLLSPFRQMRLQSGFGCLASGPLAALHVPPGFALSPPDVLDVQHAYALSMVENHGPAMRPRNDLIPSRIAIDASVFAALVATVQRAPQVFPADAAHALRPIVQWLRQDAASRRSTCHGRLASRLALRRSTDGITQAEDDLMAMDAVDRHFDFRLPGVMQRAAFVRRFARVTGYGPRQYLREWHARRALIEQLTGASAVHGRIDARPEPRHPTLPPQVTAVAA